MAPTPLQSKTIVLEFASEAEYEELMKDSKRLRTYIEECYAATPELFPPALDRGFHFHGFVYSKKLGVRTRRIRLVANGEAYQLRPSFLMPYMTTKTPLVSEILLLRFWGVPFWMLARLGGRSPMFWYRIYASLGRFSLVGTTVKQKENLPSHLLADEKHTRWLRRKAYVTTTVAQNCFLGAAVVGGAGQEELAQGYKVFREEAHRVDPDYSPRTVTTDGWEPLREAWKTLFATIEIILCFLHSWLKIKRRCRRDKGLLQQIGEKV